ncbi:MAG: transcriptional repressor [Clostridiales bacterium]|nr:transcriptional repressor [Clostridiales bacterium]
MSVDGRYKELFENMGIKNTKQREIIFDVLSKSDVPITADELFIKLKDMDTSINLSTIYRNLDMMCDKGIITKTIFMNDDKARFEIKNTQHKHRLICIKCKRMVPIDDCPIEEFEKMLCKKTSFDITGHKLEIYGYCPKCKKTK